MSHYRDHHKHECECDRCYGEWLVSINRFSPGPEQRAKREILQAKETNVNTPTVPADAAAEIERLKAELVGRTNDLTVTRDHLRTVHAHVKEALELLGVDVSINGYMPDSWTLREQCHIKARELAESQRQLAESPAFRIAAALETLLERDQMVEIHPCRPKKGVQSFYINMAYYKCDTLLAALEAAAAQEVSDA